MLTGMCVIGIGAGDPGMADARGGHGRWRRSTCCSCSRRARRAGRRRGGRWLRGMRVAREVAMRGPAARPGRRGGGGVAGGAGARSCARPSRAGTGRRRASCLGRSVALRRADRACSTRSACGVCAWCRGSRACPALAARYRIAAQPGRRARVLITTGRRLAAERPSGRRRRRGDARRRAGVPRRRSGASRSTGAPTSARPTSSCVSGVAGRRARRDRARQELRRAGGRAGCSIRTCCAARLGLQ